MKRVIAALILMSLVFVIGASGCGTQQTAQSQQPLATDVQQPSTTEVRTSVYEVAIANFAFSPQDLEVPVNSTVTWTNNDAVEHQIAAEGEGTFQSKALSKGDTYSFIFSAPGTYGYHCSIHPSMRGTITVK